VGERRVRKQFPLRELTLLTSKKGSSCDGEAGKETNWDHQRKQQTPLRSIGRKRAQVEKPNRYKVLRRAFPLLALPGEPTKKKTESGGI